MGTRALFIPYDWSGKEICVIYTQCDGYPDGVPLYVFGKKVVKVIR